jgi:hypothetical protein
MTEDTYKICGGKKKKAKKQKRRAFKRYIRKK